MEIQFIRTSSFLPQDWYGFRRQPKPGTLVNRKLFFGVFVYLDEDRTKAAVAALE